MNITKKLLAVPVLLVALGAGCAMSQRANVSVNSAPAPEQAPAPAPTAAPAPAPVVVTLSDLTFTMPADWSVRDVTHEKNDVSAWDTATISVPDPNYQVTIPLKVYAMTDASISDLPLLKTAASGAEIRQDICAPAIACYEVALGGKVYAVQFGEPDSDEPAPANLDGVWFPSTTVTADQTLSVVATVH